jgi:hypothetical protein
MATKYKTHRTRPPTFDLTPVAEVAKLFTEQQAERERRRLEVFQRAWQTVPDGDIAQRVALAVAYLGGGHA